VQGTETIFNVGNLTVNDLDIIVANNVTGGANINGAGIQAGNPATATWFFNNATTSWQSNIGITPTANGTLSLGGASNYWGNSFLTTATVTGNVQGGNLRTAGLISATGTITGSSFSGAGTNLTGTAASLTVGTATVAGTVTTAAQPNITSVGTLTSLNSGAISSSGNVTGANLLTAGLISATGNLTAGNVSATNLTGTLQTAAQTNITSVGTLSALSVTGNVQGGNLRTAGLISATGAITAGGDLSLVGNIVDTGPMTIITSSNGNITLAPNGTGVVIVNTDLRNGQANGVGNIGSATGYFNTVFAKATSAQYADLAEMYCADATYAPGTVVEFGGNEEITISGESHSVRVAGIISTNPSYLMNSALDCTNALEVALVGRVPCRVVGTIRKGDRLVASGIPGVATVLDPVKYQPGCIIGKAFEAYDSIDTGVIEVAVGRT
jgi:hypothetical protein